MNKEFSELPGPVKRLQKTNGNGPENIAFGFTLQALATSKSMGLMLVLEPGKGEDLAWLVSGLQSGAKLLAAGSDQKSIDSLKPALDVDLRVAFHVQKISNFLEDIAHHRFDLIYCASALNSVDTERLQIMLSIGGFLIADKAVNAPLFSIPPETASLYPFGSGDSSVETGSMSIYVKAERALRRRGGRQAKTSRPSLRSMD